MGLTARGRRIWCLLILIAGILVPMALKLFLVADTSQLFRSWENRLRSLNADAVVGNDNPQSVAGETILSSILSEEMMLSNKFQVKTQEYITRVNAGHFELGPKAMLESVEIHNDRKRNIDAIVTTVVAFAIPFMTFLYAFIFLRKSEASDPSTNKRMRRKERIHRRLATCRIQLPNTQKADDTNTTDQEDRRECPICLCEFSKGEVVIASKYCDCSTRRIDSTNRTDRISTNHAGDTNLQPRYYRTCFHEKCIFNWLSQRRSNPKKLCPCCRQPFFGSTPRG